MSNTVVYTIIHNGETVTTPSVPATMAHDAIKAQCVSRWPELSNSVMSVSANNVITFTLPTASKQ